MTTSKHSISKADGWVKVVDAVDDFILENGSPTDDAHYRFDDVAPADGDAAHRLPARGFAVRAGVQGDVYVRTDSEAAITILVS